MSSRRVHFEERYVNAKSNLAVLKIAECNAGKDGKVLTVDIAAAKALSITIATERRQIVNLDEAHGRVVCEQVNAVSSVPLLTIRPWMDLPSALNLSRDQDLGS